MNDKRFLSRTQQIWLPVLPQILSPQSRYLVSEMGLVPDLSICYVDEMTSYKRSALHTDSHMVGSAGNGSCDRFCRCSGYYCHYNDNDTVS